MNGARAMALETLVEGQVWAATADGQTRMTVVRLTSGALWMHAPIAPFSDLRRALEKLGTVQFVIAPSNRHHRLARSFFDAYPRAQLFVAPEVPAWNGALAFGRVLGERAPAAWEGEIDQSLVAGHRSLDEVVFFHRASRTLIVSDLLGPDGRKPLPRWRGGRRAAPAFPRVLSFRDEEAARTAIARVLAWDFERIARTEGAAVRERAKGVLREAYAGLFANEGRVSGGGIPESRLVPAYEK